MQPISPGLGGCEGRASPMPQQWLHVRSLGCPDGQAAEGGHSRCGLWTVRPSDQLLHPPRQGELWSPS